MTAPLCFAKCALVPVSAHTVECGTITAEAIGTAALEARVQTTISLKISGRIVDVLIDLGSRVSSGDLLVRLDKEELQQQVTNAEANVDAASAEIVRLATGKNRAGVIVVTHDHRAFDVFDTIYEMEDGLMSKQLQDA